MESFLSRISTQKNGNCLEFEEKLWKSQKFLQKNSQNDEMWYN